MFEQVKSDFLKNLIHEFRLIENQFQLIETDRGSQTILNAISIDRKIDWINRKSKKNSILEKITWFLKKLLKALNIMNKMHEYEMKCFFKTQV